MTSENIQKFLFLGVMILIVVFANNGQLTRRVTSLSDANFSASVGGGPPPVFVLKSPNQILTQISQTTTFVSKEASSGMSSAPSEQTMGDKVPVVPLQPGTGVTGKDVVENAVDSSGVSLASADDPGYSTFYRVGSENPPDIQARVGLVADMKSGEYFWSQLPNVRWPLASLTKLMTAAIASRNITLNSSTTLSDSDFVIGSTDKEIKAEDTFTVADLRLVMLLESRNEAAEAIANFYGRDRFFEAMNSQAASWGLSDTYFSDPSGLSAANQSTAADLSKFMRNIFGQYPEILKITKMKSSYVTELDSGRRVLINNINNFAGRPDFLGGKTGYTDEANGNLISVFSYERQPVLIIVLGTDDRFGDTEKLLGWFERNFK
jgi:D-alanyl-D-alanine endopeptidase (penicillin-binding protein 7)